jgi:hypothetical protein
MAYSAVIITTCLILQVVVGSSVWKAEEPLLVSNFSATGVYFIPDYQGSAVEVIGKRVMQGVSRECEKL